MLEFVMQKKSALTLEFVMQKSSALKVYWTKCLSFELEVPSRPFSSGGQVKYGSGVYGFE